MTASTAVAPPLLEARALSFYRQDEPVFGPLDFCLHEGEVALVEGDNGSGKTTLLRILAGLLHFDEGSLHWRGQPWRRGRHLGVLSGSRDRCCIGTGPAELFAIMRGQRRIALDGGNPQRCRGPLDQADSRRIPRDNEHVMAGQILYRLDPRQALLTGSSMGGFVIPAGWFQSVNPVVLVATAPLFAALWTALGRRGREPSTPTKMAIALVLVREGPKELDQLAAEPGRDR